MEGQQAGLSMLEMLIGIVVSLVGLGAIIVFSSQQLRAHRRLEMDGNRAGIRQWLADKVDCQATFGPKTGTPCTSGLIKLRDKNNESDECQYADCPFSGCGIHVYACYKKIR